MPNIELMAERIRERGFTLQGEDKDGQPLYSCPECGALVVQDTIYRHSRWHAEVEVMLYR